MKKNINCKNCNTKFEGNFCNNCGEKVVKDRDFTLMKIFSQALDSFTHLDSKLFKTLKYLLFFPGKLSKQYIEGIRIPYMKPFQIFVILNIIFFFLFSNDDLFRVPSDYFFQENYEGLKTLEKVRNIATETGLSEAQIASKYDNVSTNLAKGLLVLLIPIIALIVRLFNRKQKMEFGKHLIFATHFFTFVLAAFVVSGLFLILNSNVNHKTIILALLGLGIFVYYSFALKTFYDNSISIAFIKGIFSVILILVAITFYKMVISILALYSL